MATDLFWRDRALRAEQKVTELEIATAEVQRLSAALEATCRREEAQRPVVEAALRWKQADDDFGWGNGPPPVKLGVLDGLRVAVQIYQDEGQDSIESEGR